ncbi:256R [Invertebrate iridescent virus 6]|uniref:256R n=2 Tax=Iridovirus TaxID=10487 RepID=Q91FR6_IIV6|nr:256R [Invertebrate iridescent virus 6]AAK82117.1 256R [Invertebrate iridescent virus 6]
MNFINILSFFVSTNTHSKPVIFCRFVKTICNTSFRLFIFRWSFHFAFKQWSKYTHTMPCFFHISGILFHCFAICFNHC